MRPALSQNNGATVEVIHLCHRNSGLDYQRDAFTINSSKSSKWRMGATCHHPHADHRWLNIKALLEKAQHQLHFLHVLRKNSVDMKLQDSGGPPVLPAGCVGTQEEDLFDLLPSGRCFGSIKT